MQLFGRKEKPALETATQDAVDAQVLMTPAGTQLITDKDVQLGADLLIEYKRGKANLETRIVEDEQWYKIRHWEALRSGMKSTNKLPDPEPASAWLFNALANKHADAMDNFPRPNVLPRERSDEETSKTLSSILPCVLELNDFDEVYSNNWWEKLKHGTACYYIGWDKEAENGLGEICIRELDMLNVFWEPGVRDIQKSANLFIVDLVDTEELNAQYPEHGGKLSGDTITVQKYVYDDDVDVSKKSLVVDWYYKVRAPGGRQILHMVKFVGEKLLYATQNDPELRDTGLYDHGEYPVVLDILYPEKGTPVGFGYVSVCKDPQLYIDKLGGDILRHAQMLANPRYWVSTSSGVNREQFLDWREPMVEVEGIVTDERLRAIDVPNLDGNVVSVLQMKIDELKETASNRDVNSGGAGSGVTAAAAIAALQEAGNKISRDNISAAYRAYRQIGYMVVELIRQFYDEVRTFRITGTNGEYEFVDFSNAGMKDQLLPPAYAGQEVPTYRKPVFDIKISAEKKNPFSQMTQNEYAKEFYQLGFFNPERAQETLIALEMMDFEGIEKVRDYVQQGQTLMNVCQQMGQQMDQMAMIIQTLTGKDMGAAPLQSPQMPAGQEMASSTSSVAGAVKQATTPMTSYGQQLAERSRPDMSRTSNAARPTA